MSNPAGSKRLKTVAVPGGKFQAVNPSYITHALKMLDADLCAITVLSHGEFLRHVKLLSRKKLRAFHPDTVLSGTIASKSRYERALRAYHRLSSLSPKQWRRWCTLHTSEPDMDLPFAFGWDREETLGHGWQIARLSYE